MGVFEQQLALAKIAEELLLAGVPISQVNEHVLGKDLVIHKDNPYFKNKDIWGELASRPFHAALKFTAEIYKPIESERLKENYLFEAYPSMRTGFFLEAPKVSQGGRVILDDFGNPVMKRIPDYEGLAKYMKGEKHLKTSLAYSYIYEGGHYRLVDDAELRQIIDKITLLKATPYQVRDFASALIYKSYDPPAAFIEPDGYINLKNGFLKISTKELKSHSPTMFFSYILPHEYVESSNCPRWLEFLSFIFEGNQDLIDVTAEIFGYVLSGGDPWLHKAFFLEGSGRNGKSTWLAILKALLGENNYCSISLKNLDKPFSVVMADGKKANIVGELDSKDLSSEAFKTAVGGEELIAAHKGKPEYQLKFRAKIVVATNNPINFKDSSPGNYEKLYILPFNKYIPEEERNSDIINELMADLPGILSWSLNGYQKLLSRGRLPKIDAIRAALEEHRMTTDSVFCWHNEYVRYESVDENTYLLGNFYDHYVAWCKREGRYALSKIGFCRNLSREVKRNLSSLSSLKKNSGTWCVGRFAITANSQNPLPFY